MFTPYLTETAIIIAVPHSLIWDGQIFSRIYLTYLYHDFVNLHILYFLAALSCCNVVCLCHSSRFEPNSTHTISYSNYFLSLIPHSLLETFFPITATL